MTQLQCEAVTLFRHTTNNYPWMTSFSKVPMTYERDGYSSFKARRATESWNLNLDQPGSSWKNEVSQSLPQSRFWSTQPEGRHGIPIGGQEIDPARLQDLLKSRSATKLPLIFQSTNQKSSFPVHEEHAAYSRTATNARNYLNQRFWGQSDGFCRNGSSKCPADQTSEIRIPKDWPLQGCERIGYG